MSLLLLTLPLMAQAGSMSSMPSVMRPYASSLPLEIIEKKEAEAAKRAREAQHVVLPNRSSNAIVANGCMQAVEANPERAVELVQSALQDAIGRERVRAGLCLGAALSSLGRWGEARTAFVNARDAADASDHGSRARLGGMAGNAALAEGQARLALTLLSTASTEARILGDAELSASIALDRARGLVTLNQLNDASEILAAARTEQPDNPQSWLLSATLSRRQDKLIVAQEQIEKAASLAPRDPEIGLEAGVIAMLSGKEDAAKRSWQSVIATAPQSDAAGTAKAYLAQIGVTQDAGANRGLIGPQN